MRGDTRTEPPPQSVLKHSEATNGAEHVGAFRSVALPSGVATVTTRRNRRDDRSRLSEDGDQRADEIVMDAMVESAPVEVGDPLVAYSTHKDALAAPSVNGTTSCPCAPQSGLVQVAVFASIGRWMPDMISRQILQQDSSNCIVRFALVLHKDGFDQ